MEFFDFVKAMQMAHDAVVIEKNQKSKCYKDVNFKGFKCPDCDCKDFS